MADCAYEFTLEGSPDLLVEQIYGKLHNLFLNVECDVTVKTQQGEIKKVMHGQPLKDDVREFVYLEVLSHQVTVEEQAEEAAEPEPAEPESKPEEDHDEHQDGEPSEHGDQ